MLSRKYYEVFARLIGESQDLDEFTRKLCHGLKADNSQFDYSRFMNAINKASTPDLEPQRVEQ